MSFASQAREEIARRSLQKDCCVRAAAYGIACFAKYFDASGLVLQTEQELTTQVASQSLSGGAQQLPGRGVLRHDAEIGKRKLPLLAEIVQQQIGRAHV